MNTEQIKSTDTGTNTESNERIAALTAADRWEVTKDAITKRGSTMASDMREEAMITIRSGPYIRDVFDKMQLQSGHFGLFELNNISFNDPSLMGRLIMVLKYFGYGVVVNDDSSINISW